MGEVMAFRPRDEGARGPAREGAAQILFFTGVRYQRDDAHAAAPAPQRPPRQANRGGRRRRG